jgi:hypothetical protein
LTSQILLICKERAEEKNTHLIAVRVPFQRQVSDNVKVVNIIVFILNKTDYSEYDQDGFINIFVACKSRSICKKDYSKIKFYLTGDYAICLPRWKLHNSSKSSLNMMDAMVD